MNVDEGAATLATECCAPVAAPDITAEQAGTLSDLFKALADPHRVRILNLLATSAEPVCVCDLQAVLGLAQPTVSHHLRKLVGTGLLTRTQRGTWAYYALEPTALARLAAVTAPPTTDQDNGGTA